MSGPRPASHFVMARGARLHYVDWGGEGSPVMLLHGLQDCTGNWDHITAALSQRQLHDQQFLINQPVLRLLEPLAVDRLMNLFERIVDAGQLVEFEKLAWKNFFQTVQVLGNCTVNDAAHERLIDTIGERIDRQNLARGWLVVVGQKFDPRMGHFPPHSLGLGCT